MSIDASAAETYTKWSVQETLSFYGSDIPFNYTINGTTQSGIFHALPYNSNVNRITGLNIEQNTVINGASGSVYDIIMYCTNDFIATPSDSIDIDIPIDLYYTGGFRSFVGCMVGFNNVTSSDNLITNYPDNVFGLQRAPSANFSADSSLTNYYNLGTLSFASNASASNGYGNIPCRLLTFDDTDGAVASIRFQGARTFGADYYLYLIVATPYTYGSVSHDSPTTTIPPVTTAPSGTGDINVNVDVDLTETNSILTTIANGISGFFQVIIDALSDLFLPDEDYVKNWADGVKELLESHFLGTGVNVDPLIDAFEDLATYGATTSIRFPGIDLNIANTNFSVPARSVDLRPMEDSGIYNYIEIAINIAATLSVFNLVQRKIKAVLVGERVVEVEGDDD